MFVDWSEIEVKAGDGGPGLVSWRRQKFVDKGGPNGGDGGHGGSVILKASSQQNSLARFRFKKIIRADDGQAGGRDCRHGKNGADRLVAVPVGTIVRDQTGAVLADLVSDGQTLVVAVGGIGGFGNAHFKTSRRQAPTVSEKGTLGQGLILHLELKLLADVGLVGLPNAGKSSFLAAVTRARPRIANYPFTTLEPHLGVADLDDRSILIADIPGLIEGASDGRGLGHQFLRHIERTRLIVHLIDSYLKDPVGAYGQIQAELLAYGSRLAGISQVLVLTKIDGQKPALIKQLRTRLARVAEIPVAQVWAISSHSRQGLKPLLGHLLTVLETIDRQPKAEASVAPGPKLDPASGWPVFDLAADPASPPPEVTVRRLSPDLFLVIGAKIDHFAQKTRFDDYAGRERLRDIVVKLGVKRRLDRLGYDNQEIVFGQPEIGRLRLLEIDDLTS